MAQLDNLELRLVLHEIATLTSKLETMQQVLSKYLDPNMNLATKLFIDQICSKCGAQK